MALTTLTATVDETNIGRADKVVRQMTEASHKQVRGIFDHGCVSINDVKSEDGGTVVQPGDVISIRYDPIQRYHEKKKQWDDRTFTVAYEDQDLIVVDKAAGTLTVPTDNKQESNTLVDRVSIYLSHGRQAREAWVVHRLDREVSGLLVFGKHKKIADMLIEQFKQRKPERVYTTIVAGIMGNDEGTFNSYLGTGKNLDRYITGPSDTSELAITHYKVVRRMADTTQLDVTLETGRRNQIRVHLSHEGFPVLGDNRYKPEVAAHDGWIRKRLALHATTLGFVHPTTQEPMRLESPLPPALQKFLAKHKPVTPK